MIYSFIEFCIILQLSIFQSIFGVGLLLFGTPIFLLIGYSFSGALQILLPISIITSLLQIIYKKNLKKKTIIDFNLYTLPSVFIFLLISLKVTNIDIKLCVALMLIISAIITLNKNKIIVWSAHIINYRKYFLIFIGAIHGFTNMGGSFLSIFSSIIHSKNKYLARSYIAYGYLIMGIIQYSTIFFINLVNYTAPVWYYMIIPILIFFPAQMLFNKINENLFIKTINYIAIIYGMIILIILFFDE